VSLELRQLRHFEAVHRLGAFRLAAEDQAVTQSAITKSVQKLEEQLGLRLFDRTTRSVTPTAAGEQLAPRARELIRQAEELERGAELLRGGDAGRVTLGASPLPTESLVAPALGDFVAGRPSLDVELVTASQALLVERLLARELDFVVLGGVAFQAIHFQDEIAIQRLPSEPAVIVARAAHPLVRSKADSHAYLEYPWAVPRLSAEDYSRFPEPFARELQRRGIPQLKLESVSACLELVLHSDVLTGVPLSVGRRAEQRGDVVLVPYPFELRASYAILTNRRRTLGPAAQALRDAVREVARTGADRARDVSVP
jgi:DNA-binding transcriptional LysR family regulator